MIKYVCNLCKQEISSREMSVVKTQTGDKVTTAHLHNRCLSKIIDMCKKGLVDDNKSSANKKASTAVEKKEASGVDSKTSKVTTDGRNKTINNEDIKLSEEEEADIKKLAEAIFGGSPDKKEDTVTKTEEHVELLDAKKIKLSSFSEVPSGSKPRSTTLIKTQRILLCLYRGDKSVDIADKLDVSYQTVVICKSKYASMEIAKRHLTTKRAEKIIDNIINGFISHGDVSKLSSELDVSVEYINEKIAYYTGF